MWLQRLTIFDINTNKYYKEDGEFNVYKDKLRLPNCTTYCMMRQAEASELDEPKSIFIGKSETGFYEAKNWYAQTTLPKGAILREGAIAVFDGTCGHVAFVERKLSDTRAIVSQSQYSDDKTLRNYKYWETREVDLIVGQQTIKGVGPLIGFIYPEINDKRTIRNTTIEQLEVTETMVNARIKPEGDYVQKGLYIPMGIYDVMKSKVVNDYTWYQLDNYCWVREGSWTKHYDKDESKDYKQLYISTKELYNNLVNELQEVLNKYKGKI